MTRHPTRRGLSLIEVMLAMAIMLLALVAISSLVEFGSIRGVEARSHIRGTRLAQAKMAEVEAGAIPLDSAGNGTFDEEPEWSWSVNPQPQGTPNLYLVTVTASRDLRGVKFEVTLAQMIYDPSKMGTAAQAEVPSPPPADDTTDTTGTTGTGAITK